MMISKPAKEAKICGIIAHFGDCNDFLSRNVAAKKT
jgi:hypothetical protein